MRRSIHRPLRHAALALALLAVPAHAQAPQDGGVPARLHEAIEVSEHEASMVVAADVVRAWRLVERALVPLGYDDGSLLDESDPPGFASADPAREAWLSHGDLWVYVEALPYRDGTWSRVRARAGDFATEAEVDRATALLESIAGLLVADAQAEAERLAAEQDDAVGESLGAVDYPLGDWTAGSSAASGSTLVVAAWPSDDALPLSYRIWSPWWGGWCWRPWWTSSYVWYGWACTPWVAWNPWPWSITCVSGGWWWWGHSSHCGHGWHHGHGTGCGKHWDHHGPHVLAAAGDATDKDTIVVVDRRPDAPPRATDRARDTDPGDTDRVAHRERRDEAGGLLGRPAPDAADDAPAGTPGRRTDDPTRAPPVVYRRADDGDPSGRPTLVDRRTTGDPIDTAPGADDAGPRPSPAEPTARDPEPARGRVTIRTVRTIEPTPAPTISRRTSLLGSSTTSSRVPITGVTRRTVDPAPMLPRVLGGALAPPTSLPRLDRSGPSAGLPGTPGSTLPSTLLGGTRPTLGLPALPGIGGAATLPGARPTVPSIGAPSVGAPSLRGPSLGISPAPAGRFGISSGLGGRSGAIGIGAAATTPSIGGAARGRR